MWGLNDVLTQSIAYEMGAEEERAKAEKEKKASSNWHTGTPTENGLYLVCLIYCGNTYYLGMHFNDGVWNDSEYEYGFDWLKVDMLAWMPLEPYKEEEK